MKKSTLLLFCSMLVLTTSLILPQHSAYARSDDWCIGDPTILIDGTYLLHTDVAIPPSQLFNVIQHGPVTVTVIVPNGVQAMVIEQISPFPIKVNIVHQGQRGSDLPVQTQTFVPKGTALDSFSVRMIYLNANAVTIGSGSGTSGTTFTTSVQLNSNTTNIIGIPVPDLSGGLW